ncbi:MAG: esterase/lipase family protein, partial [Planctomycetaceae bacterium]
FLSFIVVVVGGCQGPPLSPDLALAEDKSSQPSSKRLERDWTMKTLGGRQFWGDVTWFHGWRIQQNVLTGHHRLLDKDDYRHASGTLAACQKKLAAVTKKLKLPPMKGKAVIVVHGIFRSSKSFSKMQTRLEKEGYTVVGFDYPSSRVDVAKSAKYLERVVTSLKGVEEIHFVAHSLGGLIVRQYRGGHKDKRVKRLVMLGVPNNGAQLADRFRRVGLYRAIFGPAGQQMLTNKSDKTGLIAKLPTPDFEFAVIAGSRGNMKGYNPLIPGDDDGTVSVAGTRLPGAADFLAVPALHSFLVSNADVIDATVRFLKSGALRADGKPHPIPKAKRKSKPKPPAR